VKCMVSIINICNDIEELVCGYQHCNTNQVMIFGRCVKVRESLCTRFIIWGQYHSKQY
jgi:hypothetical protein